MLDESEILTTKIEITTEFVKELIKPRSRNSRKGDNGIVLIVGGSRIYHGAPLLSSLAALRSGTDLVFTATPRSNVIPARSYSPDLIVLPLPDDKLTSGSVNRLMAMLPKKSHSAAVGMGMSISKPEALLSLIKQLLNANTRIVLDASALIPEVLTQITGTGTIVTPHPGEYKRIFEKDAGPNLEKQISNVLNTAKDYGITIILKGSMNIISDGINGHTTTVKRSTPAMTVGGMGDILSGLVAGFLSKYNPFHACVLGVYLNGMAADISYNRVGLHMVATDVLEDLPQILKSFDHITE